MNASFRNMNAQRLQQLAHLTSVIGARMLATIGLLALLAACGTPGAAQQPVVKVVKAAARAKPIAEAAAPLPTATAAPIATAAPTATPAPTNTPVSTAQPVSIGTNGG